MSSFKLGTTNIHGKGVLAAKELPSGHSIGEGIKYEWYYGVIPVPVITEHLGKWINHSYDPNAVLKWRKGAWHIVTTTTVPSGKELSLDYDHTPFYIEGALPHYV